MKTPVPDIHQEIENWMALAITGGLSKEEKEAFDGHLAMCPSCQKLFKEDQMIAMMIKKTFAPDQPPADFEDQTIAKFRRTLATKQNKVPWFYRIFFHFRQMRFASVTALAITMLVLVVAGLFVPSLNNARERDRPQYMSDIKQALGTELAFNGRDTLKDVDADGIRSFDRRGQQPRLSTGFSIPAATLADESKLNYESRSSGVIIQEHAGSHSSKPPKSSSVENKPAALFAGMEEKNKTILAQSVAVPAGGGAGLGGNGVGYLAADLLSKNEKNSEKESTKISKPNSTDNVPVLPDNRKLIRNATLEFEVQSYEAALDRITSLIKEEGGFVATSDSSRLQNGKVRGQIIVKVLPEKLESFLLKLRSMGDLKNQNLATEDVTKAYFDTDARLRNARRMEERLLEMLDKEKGKVSELLQVEKELARVRENIEQMQGNLKVYDALVQYATVTITLNEKDLNQAAEFLIKEKANLSIFSPDVEKAFREAKQEAEAVKAQILHSKLDRNETARVSAVLSVLVAPESSEQLLNRFKALGRVHSVNRQSERIARGGTAPSETATVQKDKVEINLAIVHDDESRKKVSLVVVSKAVEEALEKAKTIANSHGSEILASHLEQKLEGRVNAHFLARVPAKAYTIVLDSLKALGRVSVFEVQRNDQTTQNKEADDAPVLIKLDLTDTEDPLQRTYLVLSSKTIDEKVTQIKGAIHSWEAEILLSTFERAPNGGEQANLTFRLPMKHHQAFVEHLKGLGKVKNFTIKRQDRPSEGKTSQEGSAEVILQLYSQSDLIPDETGLFYTLRQTFSRGFEALMNSLQLVGVAIAYIVPWLVVFGLPIWIAIKIRSRKVSSQKKGE